MELLPIYLTSNSLFLVKDEGMFYDLLNLLIMAITHGLYYFIFTISCFLTKSGSIFTPIPGPVGTFIFPLSTFNGDVGHSKITDVSRPLNS